MHMLGSATQNRIPVYLPAVADPAAVWAHPGLSMHQSCLAVLSNVKAAPADRKPLQMPESPVCGCTDWAAGLHC